MNDNLLNHLENICKLENIEYDLEGLKVITKESQGSVRDSINILEQVRFSTKIITKTAVLEVLGYLNDEHLLNIFDFIINKKQPNELLKFLDQINFYSSSPDYVWKRLLELFSVSIRIKYGINAKGFGNESKINDVVLKSSQKSLLFAMNEFCTHELLFFKTINKHIFLELLFLRLMQNESSIVNEVIAKQTVVKDIEIKSEIKKNLENENPFWDIFIEELNKVNDPLLSSVFNQAQFVNYSDNNVTIAFQEKLIFFNELIENSINVWTPIVKKVFNANATLKIEFNINNIEEKKIERKIENINTNNNTAFMSSQKIAKNQNVIDVSDKNNWQVANALLNHFPGTVHEVKEIDE